MSERSRERYGRIAVFLLSVVLLSIFGGTLVSQYDVHVFNPRAIAMAITLVAVAIGYLAAYAPGWLYKSLAEAAKDKPQKEDRS